MSSEELELQVEQVERLVTITRRPYVVASIRRRACTSALERAYRVLVADPSARPWIVSVMRELDLA